ncbi:sugar-binding transcriptional regulator [Virgibacillus flavescens]|uniref:sugar-binding transcriptional regulator n=1 Tax=Virgibacillus flavescens TaxID=1611422 RepID=UPI003D34E2CE
MQSLIELQKKVFPDLLDVMKDRYAVLHTINQFEPIGRRSLAERAKMTERTVRGEVDFLQKHNMIGVSGKGMHITQEGKDILNQLSLFMRDITGLNVLESQLQDKLNIDQVMIVRGNSDQEEWVKHELGKAAVKYLKSHVTTKQTIAVTGGTTMASVAHVMSPFENAENCMFVPARGGIGEKVESQANTIVAEMAKRTHGDYRMLYVPDPLSEQSYQTMLNEPSIQEITALIRSADFILHGIGDALTMANRRKTSKAVIEQLEKDQAVSEAFGYYFNSVGDVVHKVRTIGIQLEDLKSVNNVVAIAGGRSKAHAITSYFNQAKADLLITDEAAAEAIIHD